MMVMNMLSIPGIAFTRRHMHHSMYLGAKTVVPAARITDRLSIGEAFYWMAPKRTMRPTLAAPWGQRCMAGWG
jgi:hypothetical protein